MNVINRFRDFAHEPGDPEILSPGPSARTGSERLARALGWFSIGLGLAELLMPHRIGRALGMDAGAGVMRAFGAREIAAGVLSLSIDARTGIASRVVGDALDVATLLTLRKSGDSKTQAVDAALAAVVGITILDIICLKNLQTARHRETAWRDYGERSGFPQGVEAARAQGREALQMPPEAGAVPI